MGNKRNEMSVPWFQVIVFLCLIETFVNGAGNGFALTIDNAPTTTINVTRNREEGSWLHNAKPSFSSKIDDVPKSHKTLSSHADRDEKLIMVKEVSEQDSLLSNSIEPPPVETEEGMEINDHLEKWMEQLGNSNKSSNNNLDMNNVITQAFRFIKLDSHLGFLASQLIKLQSIHESMQIQVTRQDAKFNLILDQMLSMVNSVLGEAAKVNTVQDKIETEIQKMNQRLDRAVEKIIQSSTTSNNMFELSKESLLQMDKMEMTSNQVLNEVKAVKSELREVGQVSVQTIYNLNKLEENLVVGLEKAGNRTVYDTVSAWYALRQDAKIIGPTVLLEDGYEGNSIQYQADASHRGGNSASGGFHSLPVKKLSLVGGTIKAESLVSCLSRKRLINGINEKQPRDCGEIQLMGHLRSGVYTIFPYINSDHSTEVYCDLETNGGGWTVIQRRTDSRENFYRTWREYEKGFGSPYKQLWIGLEKIASISQFGDQELRIEMTDWNGEVRDANYGYLRVENATEKFRLHVSDFSGSAGDSLSYHSGMEFGTKDQDNDLDKTVNCAEKYQGAWWYKNCLQSNLNGVYMGGGTRGRLSSYAMGINWYSWTGYYYSIQRTEMKIRNRFLSTFSTSK